MGQHMTDTEAVTYEVRDGVAIISLNRPDKLNAVNMDMHKGLAKAWKAVARDDAARAVVLTGTGRGFCVGQDLTEFSSAGDDFRTDDHVRNTFNRHVLAMTGLEKPVIAAVNGVAAGAGASLALAADMRFAGESSVFMQAFVRIGLVPDTGSTWFLPHIVGLPRAIELATTGRDVAAAEALEMGMVNRVVADDALVDEAVAFAAGLASMPTRSIGMTKRAMYRALDTDLPDALEHEAQLQQAARQTSDHVEGVMAFLEKRDPAFTGK